MNLRFIGRSPPLLSNSGIWKDLVQKHQLLLKAEINKKKQKYTQENKKKHIETCWADDVAIQQLSYAKHVTLWHPKAKNLSKNHGVLLRVIGICFDLKLFISWCLSILKGFRTIACWQFQVRFLQVGPELTSKLCNIKWKVTQSVSSTIIFIWILIC